MSAIRNRSLKRFISLTIAITGLPTLVGCHGDETPISPNAKTAAPARLPGENPKSPTDQSLGGKGK